MRSTLSPVAGGSIPIISLLTSLVLSMTVPISDLGTSAVSIFNTYISDAAGLTTSMS